jgi:RHS repeat-associated protein
MQALSPVFCTAHTNVDNWVIGAAERTYVGKSDIDGATPTGGNYTYLTHDHLGTPRGQWNGSKARTASASFMPYGGVEVNAGARMDLGFTGHKWDAETGNHYAPYRYLMSGHARWLSRDPLGMVDGPNLYGYVMQRPVKLQDKLGLQCDFSNGECGSGLRDMIMWPLDMIWDMAGDVNDWLWSLWPFDGNRPSLYYMCCNWSEMFNCLLQGTIGELGGVEFITVVEAWNLCRSAAGSRHPYVIIGGCGILAVYIAGAILSNTHCFNSCRFEEI